MLVHSEPQDRHGHSPNLVMVGKAKQGGGVNRVSTPPCQEEGLAYVYLPDAEYFHPQDAGPSLPVERWPPTLYRRQQKILTKKPELTARA